MQSVCWDASVGKQPGKKLLATMQESRAPTVRRHRRRLGRLKKITKERSSQSDRPIQTKKDGASAQTFKLTLEYFPGSDGIHA
jgi:hypothetical protein